MDMYNIRILYRNHTQLRILYVYYTYNTHIKKTCFPDAISLSGFFSNHGYFIPDISNLRTGIALFNKQCTQSKLFTMTRDSIFTKGVSKEIKKYYSTSICLCFFHYLLGLHLQLLFILKEF